MPEDSYIPEKRDYSGGTPAVVPLTPDDATKSVLLRTVTPDGVVDIPTKVAYGLPNELNREPNGWFWADCSTEEGTPQWSHFIGNDVCVDVSIRSWNERKIDGWKGFDEIQGHCSAVISFNRIPVWEVSGSDILHVITKVHNDIPKLLDHHPLRDFIFGDVEAIVGRKVYWRDQPAVITSFIGDQGCVILKADPGPWIMPAWRVEDYLTHSDYEDDVKTNILDPNIWWFRDPERYVFPEGIEPTVKTKQVVVMTRNGEPILGTDGNVYEWDTIEDAKQAAYEEYNTVLPEPVETPVEDQTDSVESDMPTMPVTSSVSVALPYARFEGTPVIKRY
jgi:hypothetical protein